MISQFLVMIAFTYNTTQYTMSLAHNIDNEEIRDPDMALDSRVYASDYI